MLLQAQGGTAASVLSAQRALTAQEQKLQSAPPAASTLHTLNAQTTWLPAAQLDLQH